MDIYIFPKKPRTLTIYLTEQYHQFRTLNKNAQQKNYLFTTNVFCQKNSCIICKHLRCWSLCKEWCATNRCWIASWESQRFGESGIACLQYDPCALKLTRQVYASVWKMSWSLLGMGRTWWFTRFAPNKVDGFEGSLKYGFSHLIVLDECVVAVGVCSCEDDGRMLKIPAISRIHWLCPKWNLRRNKFFRPAVCFGGCKCPCHVVKMVGRSWTGPPLLGNVQEGHLLCRSSGIFVAADLA